MDELSTSTTESEPWSRILSGLGLKLVVAQAEFKSIYKELPVLTHVTAEFKIITIRDGRGRTEEIRHTVVMVRDLLGELAVKYPDAKDVKDTLAEAQNLALLIQMTLDGPHALASISQRQRDPIPTESPTDILATVMKDQPLDGERELDL